MQRLDEELAQAGRYGAEIAAPQNESTTCEWVILPLLWALGYHRHDIASRSYDAANKLPDYTILPGTESTWYLEAKSWKEPLSSIHVDQALNYAHSNGKRWVVLSNGREWQLFDDTIQGVSADRLITVALLSEPDQMREFLMAISKESFEYGQIAKFASDQRLQNTLDSHLRRVDSDLVRTILSTIRGKLGVTSATAQDVVSYFTARRAINPESIAQVPAPKAPHDPILIKEQLSGNQSYVSTNGAMHLMTPVKTEDGRTPEEIIRTLVDSGWYVFGDGTAGRKRMKPGDRLCFYESGKGVVADVKVISSPEIGEVPNVKWPQKYRWRFQVSEPRYFFDRPIPIHPSLRRKLDAFKGKDPDSTSWSWFVQGTGIVTEHDFELLTGRRD